jgi:hypothetical protein
MHSEELPEMRSIPGGVHRLRCAVPARKGAVPTCHRLRQQQTSERMQPCCLLVTTNHHTFRKLCNKRPCVPNINASKAKVKILCVPKLPPCSI